MTVIYDNLLATAIPLKIIALIVAVTYFKSFVGGWRSLAQRYRTNKPMPAGSFFLNGSFRYVVSYNNLIRAASDGDGIYLRFWPRVAHPPLFIPWSAISYKKPWGLLFKQQTLLLGTNPAIPFTVAESRVQKLTRNCLNPMSKGLTRNLNPDQSHDRTSAIA